MGKTKAQKNDNYIVKNPTELLSGLAKGMQVKEPIKQELIKSHAASAEKKLTRAKP